MSRTRMERRPVSDLEHMDRRYLWQTGKRSRRVHIENPGTDRTFCQTENGSGKTLDGRGIEVPAGRRLCGNCIDLAGRDEADYREPSLAVLLGERLAEEDGGKCIVNDTFGQANTVAPKPRKRAKRARSAHGPRGRKPKRSNVKYARPFNDDLPW